MRFGNVDHLFSTAGFQLLFKCKDEIPTTEYYRVAGESWTNTSVMEVNNGEFKHFTNPGNDENLCLSAFATSCFDLLENH